MNKPVSLDTEFAKPGQPADFDELVEASAREHGHLCPGQVVGVRMALLGLRLLGFSAPPAYEELKRLIVFVEMDRCTADAVAFVSRVRLGRRSLKFKDFGIMAATFLDVASGRAFRVVSTEESRDLVDCYAPAGASKAARQIEAYRRMPECVLFRVQRVRADLKREDLPGPTSRKAVCQECGQVVRDGREVVVEGRALCPPCAGQGYFSQAREMIWDGEEWSPAKAGGENGSRKGKCPPR